MASLPIVTRWNGEPITATYVRSILDYDSETGVFIWKERTTDMFKNGSKTATHECSIWNAKHAGRTAGRINYSTGYIEISINSKRYQAHRLAILVMTGGWPELKVDHFDKTRTNNRWGNLRNADNFINARNISAHKDSTSRFLGVSWNSKRGKWQASIFADGVSYFLGRFDREEEAAEAYMTAKISIHSNNENAKP